MPNTESEGPVMEFATDGLEGLLAIRLSVVSPSVLTQGVLRGVSVSENI